MPTPHDVPLAAHPDAAQPVADRRRPHVVGSGDPSPRAAAIRHLTRHRLEPFYHALLAVAEAAFGSDATVVPHLRRNGRHTRLVFVVDAADPTAAVDYAAFLPNERAFWTAYASLPKPDVAFGVAVRPARGWCRTEALAPFFAYMPTTDGAT